MDEGNGRRGDTMTGEKASFCSQCGTKLLPDASYCQSCGSAVTSGAARNASSVSPAMKYGLPLAALVALAAISIYRAGAGGGETVSAATPLAESPAGQPPDISSMSPEERANRLFNRVMSLWADGKRDSAAFFAPMAMTAIQTAGAMDAHRRYDLGLVALVAGDNAAARAQSDTILKERPQHLLGLLLAARAADARGDSATARAMRARLLSSEQSERAAGLQEYTDHDADLRGAIDEAKKR